MLNTIRTPRTAIRLLGIVSMAAAVLLPAPPAAGQAEEEPRRMCTMGRPMPDCQSVLYLRASFSPRIAGSTVPRDPALGLPPAPELKSTYAVEVGVLFNRADGYALGGSFLAGSDGSATRMAVKGRSRLWLGRYAALDAGAGILLSAGPDPPGTGSGRRDGLGFTADAAVGFTDWLSVGVEGDVVFTGAGAPAHALYVRIQLGTLPSVVAAAAALLVIGSVDQG